MSLVEQTKPTVVSDRRSAAEASWGILVVEARSSTPLGPKILFANEKIGKLSGYTTASLVGSPLGLLYDRSDLASLIDKLPAIAARSEHVYMDRALLRNGGTKQLCRWTIRPTKRSSTGLPSFTLTVDPIIPASPRNATQKSFHSLPRNVAPSPVPAIRPPDSMALDYVTSRSESITMAAAGVAHDFKNALQTIKSNLELAALENPSGGKVHSYLTEAHLALGDAEILAHQMLSFTRGDRKTKRTIELGDLLRRVSRLCSAGSEVRCRLFLPEGLRRVEGDPTQIYQVLHNLVINARQAMSGGGTIKITAANADLPATNLYAMAPGRYTVASIKDRGCGIPPDILPRIFEPDFTTKSNGSGFGLASCQSIVTQHGGAIRVASKVGVGTEFLLFLPSTDAPADPAPDFITRSADGMLPKPGPRNGSGRILVVEDQVDVARATRGLLRHLGYESLHCPNGTEAIAVYREHLDTVDPIDVVLLDMTLPGGLSGMDVFHELRRIDPAARIVASSGYFGDGTVRADDAEFTGILPKPYSMEALADAMESAITA